MDIDHLHENGAVSAGPFDAVLPAESIRHHFAGQDQAKGVYAKELHIPAGFHIVSHKHLYDHISILASGVAWLHQGGASRLAHGPCAVTIPAGQAHSVHAVTDLVWFCIHPTDETDADAVDETLIMKEIV